MGASSAPHPTTVTVQNASAETFGTPTGATSFLMDLVNTLSAGPKARTLSQARLVDYVAPDRMLIYPVGSGSKVPPSVLRQPGISCVLSAYTAMVAGPKAWNANGDTYRRTETLADYTARVPRPEGRRVRRRSCTRRAAWTRRSSSVPVTSSRPAERIIVPPQTLQNGQTASHGIEGETLVFIEIGKVQVRKLSP